MSIFATLFSQLKNLVYFLSSLYFLPLLSLFLVAVAGIKLEVPIDAFLTDPGSFAKIPPYIGVISNLGAILWAATATICFFTWAICRKGTFNSPLPKFLLGSGILTTLLLIDDLFRFHDMIGPYYFGISEIFFMLTYIGLVLYGGVVFKDCILETEYLILLLALGFFGLSLFVDILWDFFETVIGHWRIFFEDGFKFLGIFSWFGYYFRLSLNLVQTNRDSIKS